MIRHGITLSHAPRLFTPILNHNLSYPSHSTSADTTNPTPYALRCIHTGNRIHRGHARAHPPTHPLPHSLTHTHTLACLPLSPAEAGDERQGQPQGRAREAHKRGGEGSEPRWQSAGEGQHGGAAHGVVPSEDVFERDAAGAAAAFCCEGVGCARALTSVCRWCVHASVHRLRACCAPSAVERYMM